MLTKGILVEQYNAIHNTIYCRFSENITKVS